MCLHTVHVQYADREGNLSYSFLTFFHNILYIAVVCVVFLFLLKIIFVVVLCSCEP